MADGQWLCIYSISSSKDPRIENNYTSIRHPRDVWSITNQVYALWDKDDIRIIYTFIIHMNVVVTENVSQNYIIKSLKIADK